MSRWGGSLCYNGNKGLWFFLAHEPPGLISYAPTPMTDGPWVWGVHAASPGMHWKGRDPRGGPRSAYSGGCRSGGGVGHCRLRMPLRLALAIGETVAARRLGALEGKGGVPPPFRMPPWASPAPALELTHPLAGDNKGPQVRVNRFLKVLGHRSVTHREPSRGCVHAMGLPARRAHAESQLCRWVYRGHVLTSPSCPCGSTPSPGLSSETMVRR